MSGTGTKQIPEGIMQMGLIIYLTADNKSGTDLWQNIREEISGQNVEVCSSPDELKERLHKPFPEIGVAVLFVTGRAELLELANLKELLSELKVVMVLQDKQLEVLEKVHCLRPRFIAVEERDYRQLGIVLQKMIKIYEKTH
jgi:hypothetical protein